jgi:hypothetical protein
MTNVFPGIGFNYGQDRNFYQKVTVTATTWGGASVSGQQPDIFVPFSTYALSMLSEGTLATNTIGFSFNGTILHGEMNPTLPSRSLFFDNRTISKIWFQLMPGSTGPVVVDVMAWQIR